MNTHGPCDLTARVVDQAETIQDPARRPVRIIRENRAEQAARQSGSSLGQAYVAALEAGIWPLRYVRNAGNLSTGDQLTLARSHVAIIGAGGLGAHIATTAARLGIGGMTIADPDVYEESNLNRQILATSGTLGANKAETASTVLAAINPAVHVTARPVRLTTENAAEILAAADVAADALDSIPDRMTLARACKARDIPLIHAAVAGFEGQVMTIYPQDDGLAALYGEGTAACPDGSPEATLGVAAVTPALVAALQVMEMVKVLLHRGTTLRNRMLYVDLDQAAFQELSLGAAEAGES